MMNHHILLILIFGLFLVACNDKTATDQDTLDAAATTNDDVSGTYTIDPSSSQVKWKGFKPTGVHNGTVPVSSGTITVENGLVTAGTIELDMTGITVLDLQGENKDRLESHLRGTNPGKEEDFFNVGKYPKATYEINSSTLLSNDPDANQMISGTLTIKDISKPVNIRARVNVNEDELTATTPEFEIDRTQFDIKFKSRKFFNDLQDDFINDEFALQIELKANR